MGKMITAVLAIAVIAGASWYALNHASPSPSPNADTHASASAGTSPAGEPSQPKRQLDHVRQAAQRMETDADQRVQDLDAKTGGQ